MLVGLLDQLEDATLLANHFLAHPDFRSWVEKLYILVKKYNITVLLVSSEMQIADPLSRATPNTIIEPVKKVSIDLNKCISHTSYSTQCEDALDARFSVKENANSTSETKEKNTNRLLITSHQLQKQSGLKEKKLHIKQAR